MFRWISVLNKEHIESVTTIFNTAAGWQMAEQCLCHVEHLESCVCDTWVIPCITRCDPQRVPLVRNTFKHHLLPKRLS